MRSADTTPCAPHLVRLAFLGFMILTLPSPSLGGSAPACHPDSLSRRIVELRAEGRFIEALDLARNLLALVERDSVAKPWEAGDADRLIETLEFIVRLPPEARSDLSQEARLAQEADEHDKHGEYAQGANLVRRQLEIRRRHLGDRHPEVAGSLQYLAFLLKCQGDYASAEPLYREAIELRRELLGPEHPDLAWSLNDLGVLLLRQGENARAEPLIREALAISRGVLGEEHELVAPCMNNLAALYWRQGDYVRAEQIMREALAIQRRLLGGEHLGTTTLLGNLAFLLSIQGDYAAAEPLFREVLRLRRKHLGNEHPDVATSLNALARFLYHKGEPQAAESLFRETLSMRTELLGESHPDVAVTLSNLAMCLQDNGDAAGAERLLRQALALSRSNLGENHPDIAQNLYNLAEVLMIRGRLDEAEALSRKALDMQRRLVGEQHPCVVGTLELLARCLCLTGELAAAEQIQSQAADIFETARLRAGSGLRRATFRASPYSQLAANRLLLGKGDAAWPAAERALGRALADLLIASHQRPLSSLEVAREDSLKRALSQFEGQLLALQTASRANTFDGADTSDSAGAFGCTGTSEESARCLEEARTRLLATEASWIAFQRNIALKYPIPEGRAFPLERVQAVIPERTALLGWLDVDGGWLDADGGRESRVVWGYVIRGSGPVNWVRLKSSAHGGDDSPSAERARDFRDALRIAGSWPFRVTSVARTKAEAGSLWAEWMAPLMPSLDGVENLVVIPSGPMLGIPVESLVNSDGMYLVDRCAISYAPSATIHTWLREKALPEHQGVPEWRALLVGDPPFAPDHLAVMAREKEGDETQAGDFLASAAHHLEPTVLRSAVAGNDEALAALPRLPGTREEVRRVTHAVPEAFILLGAEATEQEIVRMTESGELRTFRIIHLATHALVDDERPERSALVLSRVGLPDPLEAIMAGTRIFDGLLTAREVVRECTLNAELVTLSGCQTAIGKEAAGEGYIGLANAFLQTGARSLLVSLWKVEDEATALLMGRFYENLTGTYGDERGAGTKAAMPKTQALREAKRWLRTYVDRQGVQIYQHPAYWSAFILIGV